VTTPPAPASSSASATEAPIPSRAEDVQPLKPGVGAPSAALRRPDGTTVEMRELYAQKPSILIFYRGGWCPYCNTHLGQIAEAESELRDLGYQILAISPDRPEELKKSIDKQNLAYQLLSDSDVDLAKTFGLAFRVDDATIDRYRQYKIDLTAASGRDHHILPVPAVYIIDQKGTIRFAHSNPDYKSRLEPDKLLAAAKEALDERRS
jgi:peroxiredoxin